MNIAITGGTGFIGSYVLKEMIEKKHRVKAFVRNAQKIPAVNSIDTISIAEYSFADYKNIQTELVGIDVLIHIALNFKDTETDIAENDTVPSIQLFEAAAKAGVRQIIYTSSTAVADYVYSTENGRTEYAGKTISEDFYPKPTTPYGATKASLEMFLHSLSYSYNIRTNIIRPGYVFGNPAFNKSATQPDSRFRDLVALAKNNEDLIIDKNDGTQFLWAGDIAKVYCNIAERNMNRETFFVLGKSFISWKEIGELIIEKCHSSSKLMYTDRSKNAPLPFKFDVSKMKRMLGFEFDNTINHISDHIDYWNNFLV